MKKYNILVIGGGNIGHALIYDISDKCNITLIVHEKKKWHTYLENSKGKLSAKFIVKNWDEPLEKHYNYIFITLPMIYRNNALQLIKRNNIEDSNIIGITGFGNFESLCKEQIKNNNFGSFQRVPYIARIIKYGKKIDILSKKDSLNLYIKDNKEKAKLDLESIFNVPINLLESHYQNTLSNSNPLLHTSRIYTLFYNESKKYNVFNTEILFYEEWNNDASDMLIKMDNELKEIYKCKNIAHLHYSICKHYEVNNIEEMTKKIRSIIAFKNILTPMVKKNNLYYPDLKSRYFIEDFGIGLNSIKNIADTCNLNLPNITKVLNWYNNLEE
ncbi:NAD/NADP octopine/nopaline dehydrogenase family protein [Proteus mirabilis]|uniref:NAD/NADP octopine/nopaline dehydrogenase family protein n=1 Tax=Proteus mirabilis TaxID=584 RepID=UPI000698C90D|nr:NAD/NADP octopine/nopaline dehydrogenase family protein [Proteus mirabilis]MDM3655329.1 NAD/NADP octopine/nopaline dehydrogenase family protein [Proteus mirabilis]HEK2043311.1 NAD/NADP octopine/nopaline dehydrogenase family protein [Proteus mirabilis]HEK2082659.1 NAD/NADP octopine/nopaline dehydrogenase family protein [Proteus mirabilis]